MPLPVPHLDDRRYDDLVAELLARVPAHTPEWTNPRTGDPGVTLIELFAWLADTVLYRANQVPERQRRVFLNLLGLGLKPARPACGLVALLPAPEQRDALDLRARARVERPLPFETLQEIALAPVSGEVYLKRRVGADSHPALAETIAQLGQLYGGRALDTYETTPLYADGLAVPGGVDALSGVDDEPPRLDDPERQQRLVAWLRLRAAAGVQQLRLAWVGLHAVQLVQHVGHAGLVVAQTAGVPGEQVALPFGDIDPVSLAVQIAEPGEDYRDWRRVGAVRDERAYELDPQSGLLRFGDGVRGRVPAPGSRVKLVDARSGGGRAGNLPAGTRPRTPSPKRSSPDCGSSS